MNNPYQIAQAPIPQPPPQQIRHHCFSGSLHCSGSVPCAACLEHVRHHVMTATIQQVQQAWGMVFTSYQAQSLFEAYTNAWKIFHQRLNTDPQLGNQLFRADISAIMEDLRMVHEMREAGHLPPPGTPFVAPQANAQTLNSQAPFGEVSVTNASSSINMSANGMPPAAPQWALPPGVTPEMAQEMLFKQMQDLGWSPPANPSPDGIAPLVSPQQHDSPLPERLPAQGEIIRGTTRQPYVPPGGGASASSAPSVQRVEPSSTPSLEREKAQNLVEPMDAEEIAASAVQRVPDGTPQSIPGSNGVSLGNVMQVPPGMEHHLKEPA